MYPESLIHYIHVFSFDIKMFIKWLTFDTANMLEMVIEISALMDQMVVVVCGVMTIFCYWMRVFATFPYQGSSIQNLLLTSSLDFLRCMSCDSCNMSVDSLSL